MRIFSSSSALLILLAALGFFCTRACGDSDALWPPHDWLLGCLSKAVPGILASFDQDSGRFNAPRWNCQEQHAIFPLSVAWSYEDPRNPFYQDPQLLAIIGKGGDALCAVQDELGRLPAPHSPRGQKHLSYVPWIFSRWARCYLLVKEQLPSEQALRWEQGLGKAFTEINRLVQTPGQTQDGPYRAHLAAALFIAGQALQQCEWQDNAQQYMARLVEQQNQDGCWLEAWGPALSHNNSLIEAIGLYYAVARDPNVSEALARGARFHLALTWPDGTAVSAMDGRQPYQYVKNIGNVGFSWTAPGRFFLLRQLGGLPGDSRCVDADYAAAMLAFGGKGQATKPREFPPSHALFRSQDALLQLQHRAPWRVCFSAYTAPAASENWLLDRHNMLDLYHDALGLVAGGGNGKAQPLWSSFVFMPQSDEDEKDAAASNAEAGIPTAAKIIDTSDGPLLHLNYGKNQCRITASPQDDGSLQLSYAIIAMTAPQLAEAHVPFLRRKGPLYLANNRLVRLSDKPLRISGKEAGGFFIWDNLQVQFPSDASLLWPVFRQVKGDGTATRATRLSAARLVLCLPLSQQRPSTSIALRLASASREEMTSHSAKTLSFFSPSATPAKYLRDLDAAFLSASGPGESMSIKLPNDKVGHYELFVELILNSNYGIAQISGKELQQELSFDCYAPEHDLSGLLPCGTLQLHGQDLVLTLRNVGRNPRSKGNFLAIKAVHLSPAAAPATTVIAQPHKAEQP
jgi:hypothetical protein